MRIDEDIQEMNEKEVKRELQKYRNRLREHRDEKSDSNCWLDDEMYLYGLLPENIPSDPQLPPEDLMMLNCNRYYHCRKNHRLYTPLKELP